MHSKLGTQPQGERSHASRLTLPPVVGELDIDANQRPDSASPSEVRSPADWAGASQQGGDVRPHLDSVSLKFL